jgi:hypothetical protein
VEWGVKKKWNLGIFGIFPKTPGFLRAFEDSKDSTKVKSKGLWRGGSRDLRPARASARKERSERSGLSRGDNPYAVIPNASRPCNP